ACVVDGDRDHAAEGAVRGIEGAVGAHADPEDAFAVHHAVGFAVGIAVRAARLLRLGRRRRIDDGASSARRQSVLELPPPPTMSALVAGAAASNTPAATASDQAPPRMVAGL